MRINKRCTKLISLLLSCIMVMQMLPLSVFAVEASDGICGGSVTWHLDGDVLYIEGEGEMYDFLNPNDGDDNPNDNITYAPWSSAYLSKIVIGEGVTYIGNHAFYEKDTVVEAQLPSTLEGIGMYAFAYMESLEEAILPEGLTTMGEGAFQVCRSLTTVSIPSTLKVIPYSAFWHCKSLTDLTISEGVEEIGMGAFDGCSGLDAESDGGDSLSTKFDGPGLKRVEIPGSVKTIGDGAFVSCTMLHELILHEGIEHIGSGAFQNCDRIYDITLPASLKTMGEWVFTRLGGYVDYELESMGIPVTRLQNVYILSRELSLKATTDYGSEMMWFDDWKPFAVFHVYEDSVAAQEIAEYNEGITDEYTSALNYSYIPDCGHELTEFVSDDENTHTRTCVDENCTASQTAPHTLTVDFATLRGGACDVDTVYQLYCTACDYVGEVVMTPAEGHKADYFYYEDEEYHSGYCDNCWEEFFEPHEWEYEEDPTATEPYEVKAYCAGCGTTKVITALPAEATIISVKAKDETGNDAALSEDSFTVCWEDRDGNVLAEGTTYIHDENWVVTEDRPVFAVISFSDELREAYSVSGEIRHAVTELGVKTEFVLVPRDLLTVTGQVMVEGYTYLPVDMISLTLTTEIAGNETVLTVSPDSHGKFTAQIRRASTRLDYASLGYERVVLENVQMMPAVDGVIDVGTLTLVNKIAYRYPTVESSDYAAVVEKLVGASLIAVNERTGEEYNGAKIERHGDNSLAISFGMDMDKYFVIGDDVTIRCAQMDAVIFDPYTFTITREGEQVPLDITVYKAPKLEIDLSRHGYIFLFDSEENLVFDGFVKNYSRYSSFLPRDTYTLVAIEQNYNVVAIDAPDGLEQLGIPSEFYLKETIDLTEDVTLTYELPQFYYGGKLAISASFDTTLQTDGLVPLYLNFNHIFKETYEESETIELTFSTRDVRSLPIQPIQGTYAFGSDELGLSETIVTDKTDTLVVTASQPRGRITLFVKPTGEILDIIAKTSSGTRDYLTLILPEETSVTMIDPVPSGWTTNADHFVTLYAKLLKDQAPYTGYLYVNGELESEKELNITGEGRNYLSYTLERYGDGASTHDMYVEIVDKNDELVWTSENYMVTLVDRTYSNTVPKELTIRTNWQAGHGNTNIISRINLQSNPGAHFNVPVNETKINTDGTLTVEATFDYALKMSSDNVAIKDNTVYMKVFCNEYAPTPTIHDVKLRYNGETGTYDGTLTLEANTYTIRDLPYGYSFEYSMGAGGGSGFVPVGSAYGTSYSVEQLTDEMTGKANSYILAQQYDPYEYFDPDEVEFDLENAEGLTDEEKAMMRTLLAISNDFYHLQESLKQNGASVTADIGGDQAVSDSLPEAMQGIVEAAGDEIVCESVDPGIDYSDQGYTEVDTSGIRTGDDTKVNDFYMNVDAENHTVTTIDPNSYLKYTVDYTKVSPDYAGASFESLIKMSADTFFGTVTTVVDVVLDGTKEAREYYGKQILKKLGQQLDLEGDIKDLEEGIAKWQDSLDDLWTRGVLGDDQYTAAQKVLDDIAEIEKTEKMLGDLEDTLKSLRKELEATKRDIQSLKEVAGQPFNKYNRILNKLDSGPAKWIFRGLDLYGLVNATVMAVQGFNRAIYNHNNLVFAEDQAERMNDAFLNACPTNEDAYTAQRMECSDAYVKLKEELEDAKDWNDNLLRIKLIQVFGEMLSIAAGHVLKGTQGVIASLGIGIVTGGSELVILEQFNDSLDEVIKLQQDVSENCLEPLFDKNIADVDCEEPGGDGGGAGGGAGDGSGSGSGSGANFTPIDPEQKPQYPICTKPSIDPAGYVYEAVASNRIEGATAKIYYEGQNGEEVYWSEAEDYGEINPQITGIDGRFAWMTPIGNWLVKITKDGYEDANSTNDPAAVDGWLPVPPPQLDVNIALTSTEVPKVLSVGAASDQIRVVFSQYMDIAQMKEGLVTVTQNGQSISVDMLFEDAEVSPTKDGVYYGRILKLTRTDGAAFSGEGIVVTVAAAAQNYAQRTLGEAYSSGAMTVTQLVGSLSHSYPNRFVTDIGKTEQIAIQVLDTNGKPMAGVTVTARQIVGGTLSMTENAVSDANGTAVFTAKGLSAGSDAILFSADVVSTEMNTRVAPLGNTAPQKPTANLTDYEVVAEGTQLVLECATEGAVIYYTTNNTCPCTDSAERKIYDGPIEITEDTFFRIASWTEASGYSERLNLHITLKEDIHHCKDNLTRVEAKPANCTADGNIEYWSCSCGKYFKDATASVEITDKDSVVIKAGHEYGTLIAEVPAVHTASELKSGMKAHYFCDKCDTYFTAERVETTEAALVIPAPSHDYATVNGYKEADGHADTCSCGAHNTVVGHTPDIPAATETQDQKCSVCGYVLATATGHMHRNNLTRVEAKSADCTVDGNIEYWSCSCGKYFEDATASVEITDKDGVFIKAGHEYGTLIAEVPAIHTSAELKSGMKAHYFCDKCDTYFTTEKVETTKAALVIPTPIHDYTTVNGYKEADGHADTCSCGAHNTVVGHTPDIPAATETQDQKCSVCGYVLATATGHMHTNHLTRVEAKSADCTADGNIEYWSCSCGKYFEDATASIEITDKDGVVIKAGHEYGTLIAEVPAVHTATELKSGMKAHYFCDKCDTYFTTEKVETTKATLVIPAPSHDYTTVNGYKEADGHADTCSCGAHNTVVGHTPDISAATETQDQKCSVCGFVIEPKTGHIHRNHLTRVEAKSADCTADGNIEYWSCSCGKYFEDAAASVEITDKDSVFIKAGHEYGTLVAEVPAVHTATELKSGMKVHYFCDKCDTYFTTEKVETTKAALVIPAPSHDYTTVNGYKEADGHADTCSCGAHNTVVGHTPDIPAATETEDQKCSVCGYVLATATGHVHTNHLTRVEAKSADCTADGNIEYWSCSCGKYFEDATASVEITDKDSVVIKAGHEYGTLIAEVPAVHTATELKSGMKAHYFCDKCDTYFTTEKVETTKATLVIPAPSHDYTTVNGYKEADGHADTCSCGAHNTVVGHTPDIPAATETQDQKCSVCGYVMATATGNSVYLVTVVGSYASITGDGEYETGETVTIYAGFRSGYSFNGWTSSDVSITNAINADASFVMPDHAVTVTANWTKNSSGGGGGAYVPVSYTNTAVAAKNGNVSVSPKSAVKGETVTVTIAPDKGYTLETLTAIDENGKVVELTKVSSTKYTFKMPASKVTVKATFMDDNTMLNFFVDVPADAYYYDAVLWAVKEGITNGTSATTFSPDNPCTRAQMATFLWRAAGSPEPVSNTCPFVDVAADAYYAKAVQWAYEQGITAGTSATTYSPDETCARGQMATFLSRVADGKPVSEKVIFADVNADKYYAKAVQWAYEQKITSGTSATTFSPDDPCTRAQMVTFLYRYFVK